MDSVASLPSAPADQAHARFTRIGWLLIVLAFAGYGHLLMKHVGVHAGGSDSSGYLNHARLLATGHVHVAPRAIPHFDPGPLTLSVYSALGFRVAADGASLVPTYPAGLPLMIAAAAGVVGWNQAGNVVLWLHGMAGVALMYAAARTFGLSRRRSVIAGVIIAASPLYLFMTLQAMSDVPALVWTTAAIVAAWRSRTGNGWAVASGAAFAVAVLVRPTNALAIVPLAVAFGLVWRRWAGWLAGGLPGAAFFLLHSHAAYGSFFTTGYGNSAGLEWRWIGPTLGHYAVWLPVLLTPVVAAFLGLPWLAGRRPRLVLLLAAWTLMFAGFYSAYSCTHETWWYLRFLLPAAPALVIGALLVLQSAVGDRLTGRTATVAAALLLFGVCGWQSQWDRKFGILEAGRGEAVYPETAAWLTRHIPANAVVAGMQHSGALFYYTNLTFFRYDGLHGRDFARVAAAVQAAGRPLYAVLCPFELTDEKALTEHMPDGQWREIGGVRDVTVWQWTPPPDGAARP